MSSLFDSLSYEDVAKTIDAIALMRRYVMDKIAALNRFSVVGQPSSNFFLLRIEDPALDSTKMFNELLKRGVIVKDGSVSFISLGKRYLRIDVSLQKQMDRLIWALTALDLRLSADPSDPLIPTDRRVARFSAFRILPSAGKYLLPSAEQAPE